jgi:hypothetical protein
LDGVGDGDGADVVGAVVTDPPLHDTPLILQLIGGLAPLPFIPQLKPAPAARVGAQDLLTAT